MFDPLDRFKDILRKADQVSINDAQSAVYAVISDVNDPEAKGRCKVALENFSSLNGRIAYSTDWSECIGIRIGEGRLPKNIVGTPVLAIPIHNSYENVVVQLAAPLIYEGRDQLPVPSARNLGLRVIQLGTSESFELIVQLRNGTFIWETTGPLKHLHKSGDTMQQPRDVGGDYEFPIPAEATDDVICITSVKPYIRESKAFPPSF